MNKSEFQNENEPLMSESQKHPLVFVWKTGALVLTGLIFVMIIIDIGMLLYLNGHPVPPTNLTFANDVVFDSEIITQSTMIKNLMANMVRANPGFSYEFALLLAKGSGSQFTSQTIKQQIFRVRDHNLLFIFQAQSTTANHTFGLYSTAQFPIPDADEFQKNITYYTFQFGDNRKSVLFSLENKNFVKANSTNKDVENDPRLCRSFILQQSINNFSIFDVLSFTLDEDSSIKIGNLSSIYRCFDKVNSEVEMQTAIQTITGFNFVTQNVVIQSFEVFYLEQ